MTERSSNLANLHVVGPLHDDISHMCKAIVSQLKTSKKVNTEFEIRLGQYEQNSSGFTPGVSYEEFSRFYTYLESNCKKVDAENYLDIYCRNLPQVDGNQLRITISGSGHIMDYCNNNNLPLTKENVVTFQSKMRIPTIPNIDIDVYDMRLSVSGEISFDTKTVVEKLGVTTKEELNKRVYDSDKQFRLKKRYSYISPDGMFRYDITQTKQIFRDNSLKYEKTLSSSDIFKQAPIYEVELELLYTGEHSENQKLFKIDSVLQNIALSMQIRQDSELVLVKDEKYSVIRNFLSLYYFKEDADKEFRQYYMRRDKQYNRMFPGAKVSTLERVNLIKESAQSSNKPYIYKDYTVTDKADGERFILFVDRKDRVYLIDDRMNVLRTDVIAKGLESTMMDGELVITFEKGIKVYNYYAFDILYSRSEKVYDYPLFPKSERDRESSRFYKLESAIRTFQKADVPYINGVSIFNISAKSYRTITDEEVHRMKQNCALIWERREKGYRYNLDGLIFTPKFDKYPMGKLWASALKWKPPEENSIDFLVKFRSGDNSVKTSVQTVDGKEVVIKYQLADLYVGEAIEKRGVREYVEKKFDIPNTIGSDPTYLIKIPLGSTGLKDDVPIRSDTIIECVWENGSWKALKTRLDKTQRYLASGKNLSNTANNIAVAISIWSTIVEPITTDMITGVSPIENLEYYSKSGTDLTEPMRGFNNYMKSLLIGGSRNNGDALIDFSCGRGGDIKKWFSSDYHRVVGLDISRTNIESMDPKFGAMGRIEHLKHKNPQYAKWADGVKFFWADTSKITTSAHPNGVCQTTQKENATKALEKPFDVGTSFFTAHYYFESPLKIRGFFQNMYDNIRDGGLAVVTCFDGLEIFKWLEHLETGQVYSGLVKSKSVWQVKKSYNKSTPFVETSSNVGLKIDIKFESISEDYYSEYLVHPKYFTKLAEEYGFQVISDADAKSMFSLKSGTALFGDIITDLQNPEELKKIRDSELGKVFYRDINSLVNNDDYADLREWNKHNRYFIFRKSAKSDLSVPKGWRSRLSKYDCEHEYKEEEANVETPKKSSKKSTSKSTVVSEPMVTSEPLVAAEPSVTSEPSVTAEPSVTSEATPAPKKRTLKKVVPVVSEPIVQEAQPTVNSETQPTVTSETQPTVAEATPAPKKRTLKKKAEVVVPETQPTVSSETQPMVTSETQPMVTSETQPMVTSETQPVIAEATPAPKKRTLKKKVVSVAPNVTSDSQPTETEGSQPTVNSETQPPVAEATPAAKKRTSKKNAEPAASSETQAPEPEKPKKKAPAGKKKLDASPSVLEQLLKGVEEKEKKPIQAETPSELECVVDKAPVGTKLKVPKKLLGKQ